jgi:cytochrome c oxidase subunit 2
MKRSLGVFWISILLAAAGCSRNPSVLLDSAGPHAERISELFWFIAIVEIVVWALALGVLFYALWNRREPNSVGPSRPPESTEKRLVFAVGAAVGVTALILTSFVGFSYAIDKQLIDLDSNPDLEIEVTGHQWWWELRYLNADASQIFSSANEIHIPVHAKVRLKLQSNDVIHSLWFPNLNGKRDIIPGRNQDLFIQSDREGVFEGRCAEFCGLQHAFMELKLIVDSPEKFESWRTAQLLPAAEPQTPEEKHGREVFKRGACLMCHSMRTQDSAGYSNQAPDLTHLKSRMTIGAGAALNTKGYLAGWIVDPHGIKPGVHMPTILQEPNDSQALLSYLEILK